MSYHFVLKYFEVNTGIFWDLGNLDIHGEDMKQLLAEVKQYNEHINDVCKLKDVWFSVEYLMEEEETPVDPSDFVSGPTDISTFISKDRSRVLGYRLGGKEFKALGFRSLDELYKILTGGIDSREMALGYHILPVTYKLLQPSSPESHL